MALGLRVWGLGFSGIGCKISSKSKAKKPSIKGKELCETTTSEANLSSLCVILPTLHDLPYLLHPYSTWKVTESQDTRVMQNFVIDAMILCA